MRISRRRFGACLGAASLIGWPALSFAQDRPVHVLVGYAPGGAADTVARLVGDGMRGSGAAVIVENKAGAAGRLAIESLLAAPADGATLLMTNLSALTLYPHIFKALRYDPLKQFAGVGTACRMSFAIAVGAASPAKTLDEYLALARKDRAVAAYGTPGAGTPMQFLGNMLGRAAQVPLTHVAYKGGSAAVTDAVGGSLPAVITTTPNLIPMHRAGKLRILALSDPAPNPALPDVPTFKSLGYPDLSITEDFAYFARAGTPASAIAHWHGAIASAVQSSKVAGLLQKADYTPLTMTPQALDARVQSEYASWSAIVKAAGYTPEA